MRKIILVLIAVGLTVSGFAQKSADIGIWGGSSTYFGDIKESPPLQSFNLNLGAFFRYNFNARVALRTMFLTGGFSANGLVEDIPFEFKKNAQDVSAMMEINFLKYVLGEKKTPFTPYILTGIGVMYYTYTLDSVGVTALISVNPLHPALNVKKESVVALTVPFGFGVKFSIGPRLGIGAEYQMRKLFSDKFDNVDDPLSFTREPENGGNGGSEIIKYTTLLHNNDWPGYMGVHLSYKLYLNPKECPAYDRKNW